MDVIFEIIQETPWWVYLLFCYFVLIGIWATRRRSVTLKKLFILPFLLAVWNLAWLSDRLNGHHHLILYWPLGLAIGSLAGWWMVRPWKVSFDKTRHLITLPPTPIPLLLILFVFGVRYYFGYNYEMHPDRATHFFRADAIISGAITGIFVGRSFHLYNKYRKF